MKKNKAKELLKISQEFDINSIVDAYIKEVTPFEEKFYDNRFELNFLIEDIDKLNQRNKKYYQV